PVALSGRSPRESPSAPRPRAGPTPDTGGHRAPSTPWRPSLVPVASWSHPGGGQRLHAHEGVVVRHLARGVDDPAAVAPISVGRGENPSLAKAGAPVLECVPLRP